MDKLLKYLSFRGRISRQRYWLTILALFGLYLGLLVLMVAARIVSPILSLLFILGIFPVLVANFANGARRLHDRNKSGWWLLLFLAIPSLLSLMGAGARLEPGGAGLAGFCTLLSLPFSIWGLVEMGFLRGTKGPNKYGEDPLGQPVAEVFA